MTRKSAATPVDVKKELPDLEDAFAIGPLIGRVRSLGLAAMDAELHPLGATGMQFVILLRVTEGMAETAAALCRHLQYDTGSMTRLLDRLEQKGWIARERSKDDRRVVRLRVTSAGREALSRLQDSAARAIQSMLSGFSAAEVRDLRGLLNRMIDNGQQRMRRMNGSEGKD